MSITKKLGKYELRRELGKGAMGIVYEGFDPFIQRTVAVKTIQKSLVEPSEMEEAFARFRREAQAAGRLSHPKIVAIYDYGEEGDLAYIAMEYVSGKELRGHLDAGEHFEIGDCLHVMLQLLDALDYSHRRGVIHRDIKPANILITPEGNIKIADFGIAKIDSSHLTQAGMVLGTPTYMSPEQFMGKEVDGRSDLYSAGVLLYQMLTGERPFTGSPITIMNKVLYQLPVPPSHHNPQVTAELDLVILRSMAKAPEERYQTATEFMRALKQAATKVPATPVADTTMPTPAAHLVDQASLPDDATIRQRDIQFWRKISESDRRADYTMYLQQFPHGEFADLARLRLAHIEKQEREAAQSQKRRRQELLDSATRERQQREAQVQAEAARRAQQEAAARAKALAETQRQQEQARKALLAQRVAQIKTSAEHERQAAATKQVQDAADRMRRQQELAALATERSKKFAEVMGKREAEDAAKEELTKESKRKLRRRT